MSTELAGLLAKRFIQRRDVKAVQLSNSRGTLKVGDWTPVRTKAGRDEAGNNVYTYQGFKMNDLKDHISGEKTYGHYLLDADSKARVFAFDIDLEEKGSWVTVPKFDNVPSGLYNNPEAQEAWVIEQMVQNESVNPRELWLDRKATGARNWYKLQMKQLANKFLKAIHEMDIPCAAAYSGSKGVHVYGFTGEMPAEEVKAAAMIALNMTDEFEPSKGQNFFRHKNSDPIHGFPSFSVEVFPKQGTLEGKSLGNLMRLPLGKNQKSSDPTFFLDMTTPLSEFKPHSNPAMLLETGNPWLDAGEIVG